MEFLTQLDDLIAQRKAELPEGSYTTQLFQAGTDRILRKVGEECAETIIAAKNRDAKEFTSEAADLLYHLTVALHEQGLSLRDVEAVLKKRHS